ncbi:MAG: AsmA family protein, partial [Lysobacterales bacterium]
MLSRYISKCNNSPFTRCFSSSPTETGPGCRADPPIPFLPRPGPRKKHHSQPITESITNTTGPCAGACFAAPTGPIKNNERAPAATPTFNRDPIRGVSVRAGKAMASGLALVALVSGIGAVAVSRVDPGAVKDFLTDAARQATGREVIVRGATELRLFPAPTLIAENVVFGNAPWSVSPDMARVKRLEARVDFLPLFLGQLRV